MVCTVSPSADFKADLAHRLLEAFAAFGLVDHLGVGADHLDAVLRQHAVLVEVHRQVQRRLPAERRQQRVGPLGVDDLFDHFPGDRLDVGAIRRRRIGHDRGWV